MTDTLKWLYRLVGTFVDWSSRLFEVLQSTFFELIELIPTNTVVGDITTDILNFIVNGLGIGDLTVTAFLFGSGFVIFLALMILRWFRGLM